MSFGKLMLSLMREQGISLRGLAREAHCNHSYLSRLSRDEHIPSYEFAANLDKVLNAEGALTALAPPPNAQTTAGNVYVDEERLAYLANAPRRRDPAAIDALSRVLAGQRETEDICGSASLVEPVKAQMSMVRDLVTEARGKYRKGVLDVGAQWAQFNGWLNASIGDLEEANSLYRVALEWAIEADEPNMIATALNMQGHTAWLGGKPGPVVGLSEAAQRDSRISPGIRALAIQQEVRGLSLTREIEVDEVDRKFDLARKFAQEASEHPENEPPWIYFFSPDFLTLQKGLSYRLLGKHDKAMDLFTAVLGTMPQNVRNSEWMASHYHIQLAIIHEKAGNVTDAVRVAGQITEIANQTGSAGLRRDLEKFQVRLAKKWPMNTEVQAFGEALSGAQSATAG